VAGDAGPVGLIGTCRDMTEEIELAELSTHLERVKTGEREVLEKLAAGESLADLLTRIVTLIEEPSPGTIASVLLLDDRGGALVVGG